MTHLKAFAQPVNKFHGGTSSGVSVAINFLNNRSAWKAVLIPEPQTLAHQ